MPDVIAGLLLQIVTFLIHFSYLTFFMVDFIYLCCLVILTSFAILPKLVFSDKILYGDHL
jgi:hypothetical protein